MAEHNKFGAQAEELVREYLQKKGYEILDTNWRSGHKELDLVAYKDNMLVIVEVKARKSVVFGAPYEAVNDVKINRVVSAANAYIKQHNINMDTRFDVVSVVYGEEGDYAIEHFEDAFFPPMSR